jgi:succinate dehydrogenase / fumarate reductase, cytochrome b subunit
MSSRPSFFRSSVGSKYLIALSGLSLVAFLILHLIGNLMVFASPEALNHYGDVLIRNPLLIPAELALAALFLLHVGKTIALFMNAQHARPVGYARKVRAGYTSRKSWASTTMIASGAFLFVFVLLHLAQFKYGAHYNSVTQPGTRDLYRLMVDVFSRPAWVVFYVVGMVIVGFHLWHGVSSAFQSLGVDPPGWVRPIRAAGWTLAVIIAGGFLIIPLWILLGARS